ncbi:hypothetical protein [Streptomyces sp. Isolate_45]|uniref:hypothetical protein n=1 Tax=Streptomyces sp. Isolate_45 TaxID=2950111 RepID=UPI002481E679|nr:hypothetical protein [Streptomyces sp. Isolate_45]MDA5279856.1 hypothetical protein [Streptomyces sp. Isolate_45]
MGIAVAALRGMNQWIGDRRQRFEELAPVRQAAVKARAERIKAQAENAAALQKITDDATQARAKGRIQSPTEFGRSATKNGGKPGSGSSGGGGAASPKGKTTSKGSAGTPSRKTPDPHKPGNAPGKTPGALSSGASPGARKGPSKGAGNSKDPSSSGTGRNKGKDPKASGKVSEGVKSPKGAKSSNASASPAVERARGRQERAAARQTARLDGRAKDREAARTRTNAVKEARQAARGKVRNERIEAKGARKEQERTARAEARETARRARKEARQKQKEVAAADPNRTTLAQATAKEAQRRLAERRKNPGTPVISRHKKPKTAAPGPVATPGATGPKVSLVKPPKPAGGPGPTSSTAPKVNLRKPPKPQPTSTPGPTAGPKVNLKKPPAGTRSAPKVNLRKPPKPQPTSTPGPTAGPKVNLKKPPAGTRSAPKVNLRKPPKPQPTSTPGPTAGPKVNLKKPPPAGKSGRSWAFWKKRTQAPRSGSQGRSSTSTSGSAAPGGSSRPGSRSRSTRQQQTPPPQTPDPDGAWLKPPPGMTATYTLHRLDPVKPKPTDSTAVTSSKRLGLPPGSSGSAPGQGPAIICKFPNPREGARPMGGAPVSTQFKDADLTVYDVIESDEDMADEILLGASHATLVAERCEGLVGALEALRAELMEKSVPGVFVGWCTKLIERAGVVQEKAEAVAQGLPRAAEAIAHAGQVAAEHDKPAADLVRDLGHTAPADASYHKE